MPAAGAARSSAADVLTRSPTLPAPLARAQEAIRELQLCTAVESEEMQRLGVKLEMDEASGKLRVTQRPPPGVAGGAASSGGSGD